ncbi:hypothetical protein V6N13_137815 [Hibiscus sabdariffa]|uniref:Cytochrome b5 heme-binding domain-containing protein n=1 Tax=Hibiscus sabdariffa TaxID=183260 RepID=A0ABR2DKM3_9ROSI
MGGEGKVYTLADVSQHNNAKDCWLVIGGKVYNVTKFLEDHPGGDEVLLSATGKDATDDFEDVGHSRALLQLCWMSFTWVTSIHQLSHPIGPIQSTLLRSSLTMSRIRPRNSL